MYIFFSFEMLQAETFTKNTLCGDIPQACKPIHPSFLNPKPGHIEAHSLPEITLA
jgi:hypothetical protein